MAIKLFPIFMRGRSGCHLYIVHHKHIYAYSPLKYGVVRVRLKKLEQVAPLWAPYQENAQLPVAKVSGYLGVTIDIHKW